MSFLYTCNTHGHPLFRRTGLLATAMNGRTTAPPAGHGFGVGMRRRF